MDEFTNEQLFYLVQERALIFYEHLMNAYGNKINFDFLDPYVCMTFIEFKKEMSSVAWLLDSTLDFSRLIEAKYQLDLSCLQSDEKAQLNKFISQFLSLV